MVLRQVLLASAVGSATLLLAASAQAGGGCKGSACYNLVSTPPVYGSVSESYMVAPERRSSRVIPAEYAYTTEKVLVEPARKIARHRPAEYRTVTEKVKVSAATRRWEVTTDAYGRTTGCWVDVPAQYAYQTRTVMVAPPSVDYEIVPAVYAHRQQKVMVRPTQVVHDTIPAVYETRQRKVLISPGSKHWARY